jgi:oligoribonuclease
MPGLSRYLHYRLLDVSTLKVVAGTWYDENAVFKKSKEGQHDALVDIKNSIAELKHYQTTILR